ncbi:MAG: YdeI/OmpD-associated family protein [Bacteroidota bacterium]
MISFKATIHKYGEQGEKTGWTYIEVPLDASEELNPGVRKSYRVKGFLDKHPINGVALIPSGGGIFIIPVNAAMRKAIAKKEGAMLMVKLALDTLPYELNKLLVECLHEAPNASKAFYKMPRSHQNYYSKWVDSAKTDATKEKRIVLIITSLERGLSYGEMLREQAALKK